MICLMPRSKLYSTVIVPVIPMRALTQFAPTPDAGILKPDIAIIARMLRMKTEYMTVIGLTIALTSSIRFL